MTNEDEMRKELSLEQREGLLKILKARFEKNIHRHKGLEWAKLQVKLDANPEKLWSLNEMEKPAVNRMLLLLIHKKTNTFFTIVQRKVLKGAEVFATIVKRWNQEKNISRKITPLTWQLLWELTF